MFGTGAGAEFVVHQQREAAVAADIEGPEAVGDAGHPVKPLPAASPTVSKVSATPVIDGK